MLKNPFFNAQSVTGIYLYFWYIVLSVASHKSSEIWLLLIILIMIYYIRDQTIS